MSRFLRNGFAVSIINGRRHDLINYTFERVSEELRSDLSAAVQRKLPFFSEDLPLVMFGLECFCQIYDQQLILEKAGSEHNSKIVEAFCALVFEGKIFDRSKRGNILLARYFLRSAQDLPYIKKCSIKFSSSPTYSLPKHIEDRVNSLSFNEEKHKFWSGWVSVGAGGSKRYFPLQDVYRTCGAIFAEQLFVVLDCFNRTRQRSLHSSWREMFKSFADLGRRQQLHLLDEPDSSREFFNSLLIRYLAEAKGAPDSIRYSTLALEWRNHFSTFVRDHLIPAGLVAEPSGGFPMPRAERVPGARMNVRVKRDGTEVKEKLITDVPLYVTDREAIELIFKNIRSDVGVIRKWAEQVTGEVWGKYECRKERAPHGIALPISVDDDDTFSRFGNSKASLKSPDNPDYLKHMAATFECHGYLTSDDTWIETLYADKHFAAKELGMPSIKVLLAYCALLVIHHPMLTKSALLSLEMFDGSGAMIGLRRTDSCSYLVSYKRRAGASNAEKNVRLNEQSLQLVERLIEITNPLREYMRDRENSDWRHLFLSSGHAFAPPKKLGRSEISYRDELKREFRKDLGGMEVPDGVADRLSKSFTLTRLRGSVGVEEYLRTTSVSSMARALGHKEYKKSLIDHYLPEPIRCFYEERWVRIFQAGIVCEALKESSYLVQASGFDNMEEVDEFLRNHVISFPDIENADGSGQPLNADEVIFGLNEEVLCLLYSLVLTARTSKNRLNALAGYWSSLAEKLIDFINSSQCQRLDIRSMLSKAKAQADPKMVRHLLT